jgi:hypothetical protein
LGGCIRALSCDSYYSSHRNNIPLNPTFQCSFPASPLPFIDLSLRSRFCACPIRLQSVIMIAFDGMRPSNLLWAQCCTMAWSESSRDFCTKARSPKCNASNRSASRSANSCLEPQWLLNLAQRVTLTLTHRDFTQGEKSSGRVGLCTFLHVRCELSLRGCLIQFAASISHPHSQTDRVNHLIHGFAYPSHNGDLE